MNQIFKKDQGVLQLSNCILLDYSEFSNVFVIYKHTIYKCIKNTHICMYVHTNVHILDILADDPDLVIYADNYVIGPFVVASQIIR